VVVRGHGFRMPVERSDPIVGFSVTFHVARARPWTQPRALQRARDRWETFYAEATGDLVLAVAGVERLRPRFVRRSRTG